MASQNPISLTAFRMRNQDVSIFDSFVGAVEDYYNTLASDLIQASPNDILVAQGRAQVMGTFLRTLKECHLVRQQKPSTAP